MPNVQCHYPALALWARTTWRWSSPDLLCHWLYTRRRIKVDFKSFHFLPTVFTSSCPVLLSRLLICLSVFYDENKDDYGDDDCGLIVWVWMAVQKFTSARNVPLFYSSTSKWIYISISHSSKATWNLHELFPQGCVCVVTQWQGNGVQAAWPLVFIILSTKLLFLSLDHRILLKLLSHLGILKNSLGLSLTLYHFQDTVGHTGDILLHLHTLGHLGTLWAVLDPSTQAQPVLCPEATNSLSNHSHTWNLWLLLMTHLSEVFFCSQL